MSDIILQKRRHDEAACDIFRSQFLVDDLERSIAYYQEIGFTFSEPWEGFYAIGVLDGLELQLKEAPKNDARPPAQAQPRSSRRRGGR